MAKLIAFAFRECFAKYTSFGRAFSFLHKKDGKYWKYLLGAADLILELKADPNEWVEAQFWMASHFHKGIYPPAILTGPMAKENWLFYHERNKEVKEEDISKMQQGYLDKFVELYGLTEKQVLALFKNEGIFSVEFIRKKNLT